MHLPSSLFLYQSIYLLSVPATSLYSTLKWIQTEPTTYQIHFPLLNEHHILMISRICIMIIMSDQKALFLDLSSYHVKFNITSSSVWKASWSASNFFRNIVPMLEQWLTSPKTCASRISKFIFNRYSSAWIFLLKNRLFWLQYGSL